jgi:hypothetical protein
MLGRVALMTAASALFASSAFAQQGPPPGPPPAGAPPPAYAPAPGYTAPPPRDDTPAQNTVYAEGMGAGLLYSLNYERRVIDELGVRAGFGYWTVDASAGSASSKASYLTIPLTVSYLGLHSRRATFEVGGGMTLLYTSAAASGFGAAADGSGITPLGTAFVGYRLHPVGGGFNFRIGAMALIGKGLSLSTDPADADKVGVLPWLYMSLGASF